MTDSAPENLPARSPADAAANARLDALARDTVPMPSNATWARMWTEIDGRLSTAHAPQPATAARRAPLPRMIRIWQPFAAAAACVLMIVSWALVGGPQPAVAQVAFRPATDNNVNSLDAPDSAVLLMSDGEGWVIVLDENGGSES